MEFTVDGGQTVGALAFNRGDPLSLDASHTGRIITYDPTTGDAFIDFTKTGESGELLNEMPDGWRTRRDTTERTVKRKLTRQDFKKIRINMAKRHQARLGWVKERMILQGREWLSLEDRRTRKEQMGAEAYQLI